MDNPQLDTPTTDMGNPALGGAPPVGFPAPAPDSFGTPLPPFIPEPPSNPAEAGWIKAYRMYADAKSKTMPGSFVSSSAGSSETG